MIKTINIDITNHCNKSWQEAMKINEVLYAGQEKGIFIAPCKNCNYWEERKNTNGGKACLL